MSPSTSPAMEMTEAVGETTKRFVGEGNGEKAHLPAEPVASRRWVPGGKVNFPWMFVLALLGTIAWFGGCIEIIFTADNTKVDSWAISPTVILAILGPLGSIIRRYALSCGLVITWWNSALSGTTIGSVHRQWDHGTSVWAATTSRRHMDRISLAKLMVLSLFRWII
ncbi:hypothetical protein BCR34DRAFT_558686 [Clohesyomyces aquaticus]|uniref:Uncharacterized protein n=1 Tax=Clohesyomyces aquaticus TaxID=1231657 RepID=A0A1Y1ZZA7_9PLEO|nr:hypothetical protein BCR34DRAFT_558686 [Clohesyomyces aquaticus]